MSRPSWDTYFASITRLVSTRSTCLRAQHGAVVVRRKHIIATGYNGSPPNTPHCVDVGCPRIDQNVPSGTKYELCRSIHAEQNAICQAAKLGLSLEGATIYITDVPCTICAKMIHSAGIKDVVILQHSRRYDPTALADFLTVKGNSVRFLDKEQPI